MKARKLLATLLALAMTLSMLSVGALAAETEDEKNGVMPISETGDTAPVSNLPADAAASWAADSIERWTATGIVKGDGAGNFNPDAQLTRGELAQIFVNMFGLTVKAENTFGDLKGDEWYADAILKCVAAGIMKGDGVNVNAEAKISRGETIVMFGRAVGVTPDENPDLSKFTDADSVADWAAGYLAPLTKMGILSGSGDGTINAVGNIDRASVMSLLDKAVITYINAPGEYTLDNPNAFVIVNVAAKEGEVIISGVAAGVAVSAGTAEGKIVAKDLKADTIKVDGAAALNVEGKSSVGEVVANATGTVTIAKGVTVDTVTANSTGTVANAGTVNSIVANDAATVSNTGTVKELVANAPAKVDNQGTITKAEVKADGVVLDGKKPTEVKVDEGTKNPTDSTGKEIPATPDKPTGGTGGGYNPGPSTPTISSSNASTSVFPEGVTPSETGLAGDEPHEITSGAEKSFTQDEMTARNGEYVNYITVPKNIVSDFTKVVYKTNDGSAVTWDLGGKASEVGATEGGGWFAFSESNYYFKFGTAFAEKVGGVWALKAKAFSTTISFYNDTTLVATLSYTVDLSKVTIAGVTEVSNATELVAALLDTDAKLIDVTGTIGSTSAYGEYTVERSVAIKGGTVHGTFVVTAEDVTFDGVTVRNEGDVSGQNTLARAAIYANCDKITLTDCTFDMRSGASGLANGVVIYPKNTSVNYTISGNTFKGYKTSDNGWTSTALSLVGGANKIDPEHLGVLANLSDAEDLAIIEGNTFDDCKVDYSRYVAGSPNQISCTSISNGGNTRFASAAEGGAKYYITGNVTRDFKDDQHGGNDVDADLVIKANTEVIVTEDAKLTIPTGVVLTNNGTLTVKGTLAVADEVALAGLLAGDISLEANATVTVAGVQVIGADTLSIDAGRITVEAYEDTLQRAGIKFTVPSGSEATIAGPLGDDDATAYRISKSDCITVESGGVLNINNNTNITGVLNVAGAATIAEDVMVAVLKMESKPGVLNVTGTLDGTGYLTITEGATATGVAITDAEFSCIADKADWEALADKLDDDGKSALGDWAEEHTPGTLPWIAATYSRTCTDATVVMGAFTDLANETPDYEGGLENATTNNKAFFTINGVENTGVTPGTYCVLLAVAEEGGLTTTVMGTVIVEAPNAE